MINYSKKSGLVKKEKEMQALNARKWRYNSRSLVEKEKQEEKMTSADDACYQSYDNDQYSKLHN
jgi:hypothetical protein